MAPGGTCSDVGPFFPQTPLYLIQNGVSLRTDILLEPDWVLIGVLVAASVVTIIILLLALYLFREYGWAKDLYLIPWYRKLAQKFSFDDYSSKVCFKIFRNLPTCCVSAVSKWFCFIRIGFHCSFGEKIPSKFRFSIERTNKRTEFVWWFGDRQRWVLGSRKTSKFTNSKLQLMLTTLKFIPLQKVMILTLLIGNKRF